MNYVSPDKPLLAIPDLLLAAQERAEQADANNAQVAALLNLARQHDMAHLQDRDLTELLAQTKPGSELPDTVFRALSTLLTIVMEAETNLEGDEEEADSSSG